jgi:hypothetical protein
MDKTEVSILNIPVTGKKSKSTIKSLSVFSGKVQLSNLTIPPHSNPFSGPFPRALASVAPTLITL